MSSRQKLRSHYPGSPPQNMRTVHGLPTAKPAAFCAETIQSPRDEVDAILNNSGRLPKPPALPNISGRTKSGSRLKTAPPNASDAPERAQTIGAVPNQLRHANSMESISALDTIAPDMATALRRTPPQTPSVGPRFSSFVGGIELVRSQITCVDGVTAMNAYGDDFEDEF